MSRRCIADAKRLTQSAGIVWFTARALEELVEFGRVAERDANQRGSKRLESIYLLDFASYCTLNRGANFKGGIGTEKSRLRQCIAYLRDLMRRTRHLPIREQWTNLY